MDILKYYNIILDENELNDILKDIDTLMEQLDKKYCGSDTAFDEIKALVKFRSNF